MFTIPEGKKKRILSLVMDFIRSEDLKLNDNFPISISECYASIVEKSSKLPDFESFLRGTGKIRTTFFKINYGSIKRKFLQELLAELNHDFGPILKEIKQKQAIESLKDDLYEQIYIDDIDSFEKVKRVSSISVEKMVPLTVSEKEIKDSLANIIGEKFVPKDWGGEKSDLYSSRVIFKGKRISTAFLLKGPSVKKLTINKCGKRGDQIIRLFREPAQLFVIQHIDEIDTNVVEFLEICVSDLSKKKDKKLYYCTIDGVDTARILYAYNKLNK